MDNSKALLDLLERILGRGTRKNQGNYAFVCPFHTSNPPGKRKLEVNIESQFWKCWTCGGTNNTTGKKIKTLFKKLEVSADIMVELKLIFPNDATTDYVSHHSSAKIELPKEYISLINIKVNNALDKIRLKQAQVFLNKRGISEQDIQKFNIGICLEGNYVDRIIIPSYDTDGRLNYFNARDFTATSTEKYKNPANISAKDVIGFELFINWNIPIILVEGVFDALTIKRNTIPLFGKVIHEPLMKKLMESKVRKIYIALDTDARTESLKYCEQLLQYGKEVYLLDIGGKDFNEIGFKKTLEVLEDASALTFQELIIKKLEKI